MPSVWIFNHYAGFPETVPATRTYELATRLATAGWDVSVVACSFNHYTFAPDFTDHQRGCTEIQRDGVRWVFIKGVPYSGNGARRFLNMMGYAARATQWARSRNSPDVVIGTTVHPFAAEAARRVARAKGARFVYEVTDLWPESLVDLGHVTRQSRMFRLMASLERRAFVDADGVVGLPPGIDRYARDAYGLDLTRYAYIPNGSVAPAASPASVEVRPRTLVYAGGFAPAHGLDTILGAAEQLNREAPGEFEVHLYGDGPERRRLQARARSQGLEDTVRFHGLVPKEELAQILPSIDICLCTGAALPVHRYGVSTNKLFDYFAAARPIVFSVDSENSPVTAAGAGMSVPAADGQALAQAVLELDSMGPQTRADMGQRGHEFLVREHSFDVLAERLEAFLLLTLNANRLTPS